MSGQPSAERSDCFEAAVAAAGGVSAASDGVSVPAFAPAGLAGVLGAVGRPLGNGCISVHGEPVRRVSNPSGKLTLGLNGDGVPVAVRVHGQAPTAAGAQGGDRGKRGAARFSRASLRNLRGELVELSALLDPAHLEDWAGVFCSLTLGRSGASVDAEELRRVKHRLRQWFARMAGVGLWVVEWQGRGALHWHIVCRLVPGAWASVREFETALLDYWLRLTGYGGSPTASRRRHAVDVQELRGGVPARLANYLAKELSKSVSKTGDNRPDIGRYWATFGGDDLDRFRLVEETGIARLSELRHRLEMVDELLFPWAKGVVVERVEAVPVYDDRAVRRQSFVGVEERVVTELLRFVGSTWFGEELTAFVLTGRGWSKLEDRIKEQRA